MDKNDNEGPGPYLERIIKTERVNVGKNLAKSIGIPILALGGIGGISSLLTYPIQNPDLKYLLALGTGVAMGAGFGSGVADYTKEKFDEFRDSLRNLRNYRKELDTLQ